MTDFFKRLITISRTPSFARIVDQWQDCNLFENDLPEIHQMKFCDQPAQYHPEGDVWKHTLAALYNIDLSEFPEDDHWIINLAIFFHDIGKPTAMSVEESTGKIRYLGHDAAGCRIFDEVCRRHGVTDLELIENIKFPIKNHMKLHLFNEMRQKKINALVEHEKWPILKAVGKADIYSRRYNEDGTMSHIDCDCEYGKISKYDHVIKM